MMKDKLIFANLDKSFFGIIHNASETTNSISGRGYVEFFAKNSNEGLKQIVLKDALFVPDNLKSLISVSKLERLALMSLSGKT